MQEQKASKIGKLIRRIGIWNLVFLILFGGVLVVALGVAVYSSRNIPTSEWRETERYYRRGGAENIELQNIETGWKSSKGNARLELRTAYYPSAKLTIAGGKSSGRLLIRFQDSRNQQQGDTLSLSYRDGKFVPRKDVDIQAENNTATVLLERGFVDDDSYLLHCLNEEEPLWRVYVWQQPEGTKNAYLLGYRTITALPPTALK